MNFGTPSIREAMSQFRFLLDATNEFGEDGEAAIAEVCDCVTVIFSVIPPKHINAQLLVKRVVQGSKDLDKAGTRYNTLESLCSELNKRINGHENFEVTILGNSSYLLRSSDKEFDVTKLSVGAVVYQYCSQSELFRSGDKQSVVQRENEYSYSRFEKQTYATIDTALEEYSVRLAENCTCKILSKAWIGETDGLRLVFSNKPESIMRDSLKQFLVSVLKDATVKPEQNTDETKPVDLRVNWYGSRAIALIEIKWVGRAVSKSSKKEPQYLDYAATRVERDGATQIIDYVEREKSTTGSNHIVGYLVTFDGRRRGVKGPEDKLSAVDAWFFVDKEFSLDEELLNNQSFASHKRIFLNPRIGKPLGGIS